jgi:hypothetical protein
MQFGDIVRTCNSSRARRPQATAIASKGKQLSKEAPSLVATKSASMQMALTDAAKRFRCDQKIPKSTEQKLREHNHHK